MNKNIIEEKLIEIGLSEEETIIYLYLIKNGKKSLLELSRELEIDRSKIYRTVEKMLQKHLIEETFNPRGKKIKATTPETLQILVQLEEEKVAHKKHILPEITDLLYSLTPKKTSEFEVNHYIGIEKVKQMMWNQTKTKTKLFIMTNEARNKTVGKDYAEKIRIELVQRNTEISCLYNFDTAISQDDSKVSGWEKIITYANISESVLEIRQQICIYNDVYSIIDRKNNELIGIEIVDSNFVDLQKQIFQDYWETVKG